MIVPLLVAALVLAPAPPAIERALSLAWRGDLAEARRDVDRVLQENPNDAAALIIGACVAIEEGRLDDASRVASRLATGEPPHPAAAVLAKLVQRRRSQREERMRDALAAAWKEAGRPDLGSSPPFRDLARLLASGEPMLPPLDAAARGRLTPGELLVFEPGPLEARPARTDAALQAAEQAATNPVYVNLEVLALLRPEDRDGPEVRARKARAARLVGASLARTDPENGYMAAVSTLAGVGDGVPLDAATLADLEAAVARKRFEYPRRAIRDELAVSARRADPVRGDLRAVGAALGSPLDAPVTLWHRAEATTDPAARSRAGDVMAATARRLEASLVLLERMVAMVLERKAAGLSGDPVRVARAKARGERLAAWVDSVHAAQDRLGAWPLVSTWREWDAEDEIPFRERLLE